MALRAAAAVFAGLLMGLAGGAAGPVAAARGQDAGDGREEAAQRDAPRAIEEIVVRARKRSELLEDVPVSVTAIGHGELKNIEATRLDDIQLVVPNLQFRRSGIAGALPIFIRGIGQQDEALAFDQGVGVYVDGMQLSRSIGLLLDLVDVEQIEVLRGPQGTLFGRNVVGGAISVSTVRPSEELSGSLDVLGGNFDTARLRATLNAPLGPPGRDVVLSRFTFLGKTARGYIDNTYRGEHLSDDDGVGFLGSLRWLPAAGLSVDVSGSWERSHRRGTGGQCVPVQRPPDPVVGLLADTFYPGYQEACAEQDPFHVRADAFTLSDLQSYGTWGTATWDLGAVGWLENLTLKSITGWREQRSRYRTDTDFQEFPIVVSAHIGGDDPSGAEGEPLFAQQISEEVQAGMGAADGRLNAVVGAFFYSDEARDTAGQSAFRYRADGSPGVGNGTSVSKVSIDNFSWALFTQATYDVVDWAGLTAGVRYTKERKQLAKREVFPLLDEEQARVDATGSKEFDQWTPMASLALRVPDPWLQATPIDRFMGYFTYARGFKGGGFNAVAGSQVPEGETATELDPFRPEKVDSFEIGFKSFAFARRLGLNVALFHADYRDIQVVLARLESTSPDTLPSYLRVVDNAARATVRGVEVELEALPLWDLEVQGSIGLLDAEYDDFDDAPSDLDSRPIDRAGESFPNVPDLQTHVAVQYPIAVAPALQLGAGTVTPRLDWYYQSAVHYAGPEVKALVQPGYNLLDARLAYALWDDHLELALWAKNLLDETYFAGGAAFATLQGNAFRFTSPPRTFGGEVRVRF